MKKIIYIILFISSYASAQNTCVLKARSFFNLRFENASQTHSFVLHEQSVIVHFDAQGQVTQLRGVRNSNFLSRHPERLPTLLNNTNTNLWALGELELEPSNPVFQRYAQEFRVFCERRYNDNELSQRPERELDGVVALGVNSLWLSELASTARSVLVELLRQFHEIPDLRLVRGYRFRSDRDAEDCRRLDPIQNDRSTAHNRISQEYLCSVVVDQNKPGARPTGLRRYGQLFVPQTLLPNLPTTR